MATSSTTALQSLEESRTLALSTLVTTFLLFLAISNPLIAILLISSSLYTRESVAVLRPSTTSVFLSPKYKPPVNSLMITISIPWLLIDSLSGHASASSLYKYAGRTFANNPSSFLILRRPASGLKLGATSYHLELPTSPPTAPRSTASPLFAISRASSVRGTP